MKIKKDQLIRFRCTAEERMKIEIAAQNQGISISEYILKVINSELKKNEKSAERGHTTTAPSGDQ